MSTMSDDRIEFRWEIYNEVAWGINGFIFRNYAYDNKPVPEELQKIDDEALTYTTSRDLFKYKTPEELDKVEQRLKELSELAHQLVPQPHR